MTHEGAMCERSRNTVTLGHLSTDRHPPLDTVTKSGLYCRESPFKIAACYENFATLSFTTLLHGLLLFGVPFPLTPSDGEITTPKGSSSGIGIYSGPFHPALRWNDSLFTFSITTLLYIHFLHSCTALIGWRTYPPAGAFHAIRAERFPQPRFCQCIWGCCRI